MAKSDIDRRVDSALRALVAPRENSIRHLATVLDDISNTDAKIDALLAERDKQVKAANASVNAAKAAGWKAKELTDAGLVVPRAYAPPTASKSKDSGSAGTTSSANGNASGS
ncbi:hypothetical protein [Pimelobacter sp. 30-1]|uniref:hypothetical protein n=1 Tax=Pimelobacter sp. 30-1 TaxID=2004991 RepID=UPI001C03E92A|nr:hypothetical protein [Pimelobacter sp. 30-1]MBU2698804.1 hypothetical protein [Pimelobacter sp. 30-1]